MKQTAVEWLAEKYDYVYWMVKRDEISPGLAEEWKKHYLEQAKEMERQRMIDLVQQLKDYTRESNNVLGFDEREASEFVEIFYNETFKSEKQSYQDKMRDKINKAKSRIE